VRHKQFVHQPVALLADGGERCGSGMDSDDQAHTRPRRSESNIRAIVKRARRSTFRMSPLRIWRASENCFDCWHVQERIVLAPCDHPEARSEYVGQRCRVAIQSIEADQHVGMGKSQGSGVTPDHLQGAFEFAAILAVACPPQRAQKLMRVGLQNGGPGSSHLSPFPPQIAGGANSIKTTMWVWQRR